MSGMKVHVISDNNFFITGLQSFLDECEYITPGKTHSLADEVLHISPGDVIILYLADPHYRARICRHPSLLFCRVLVITDVPVRRTVSAFFPWLLSAKILPEEMKSIIQLARKSFVRYRSVNEHLRDVIKLLVKGYSVAELANELRLSKDYIYRVARRETMRYGLSCCNRMSLPLCRDIHAMSNRKH